MSLFDVVARQPSDGDPYLLFLQYNCLVKILTHAYLILSSILLRGQGYKDNSPPARIGLLLSHISTSPTYRFQNAYHSSLPHSRIILTSVRQSHLTCIKHLSFTFSSHTSSTGYCGSDRRIQILEIERKGGDYIGMDEMTEKMAWLRE